jgi:FkbM family methyltransferase
MSWLARTARNVVARLPGGRRLSAELEHSRRQRDALQKRLEKSEQQREVLRRRLDIRRERMRASMPDSIVLEQSLSVRHAALLRHANGNRARAERESVFAARSTAYREVLVDDSIAMMEDIVSGAIGGLHWAVPAKVDREDSLTGRLVWKSRLPLEEILRTRELAVGRAMIDIGANVGTTSIPRVVLGDFGWVYAIEPDPANYRCLFNNVVINGLRGLVLPDRVAIGDTNGEMTLRTQASGTHHLVTRAADVSDSERVTVACLTLDTWVERMGIDLADVAFIKSDTQGWDARVLAGASHVLSQKHIAWQIEFSPAMLERSGRSMDEVYALLERHFTHFIDLRSESGAHVRPASALRKALAYVGKSRRKYTNVLLYSADHSRTT